jgi:hypothetical protein
VIDGRHWRLIIPALALMGFAQADSAAADTTLVMARLINSRLDPSVPAHTMTSEDGTSSFPIDRGYRLVFHPIRLLAGTFLPGDITFTRAGERIYEGGIYYLLVDRRAGEEEVVWWESALYGLCLDYGEAKEYGLGRAVRLLNRKYPCVYYLDGRRIPRE